MEFQHEIDLIKYLAGTWEREDKKLTIRIFSGHIIHVIFLSFPPGDFIDSNLYDRKLFSVKFDDRINSWRISGLFFGEDSVISDVTEDSFHLTVNPHTFFVPPYKQHFTEFKVVFNRI